MDQVEAKNINFCVIWEFWTEKYKITRITISDPNTVFSCMFSLKKSCITRSMPKYQQKSKTWGYFRMHLLTLTYGIYTVYCTSSTIVSKALMPCDIRYDLWKFRKSGDCDEQFFSNSTVGPISNFPYYEKGLSSINSGEVGIIVLTVVFTFIYLYINCYI